MGYRLYVYEKGKEKYDVCLGKFYGYSDYKHVKASWEYLWPIVKDQFDTSLFDDSDYEESYQIAHLCSCVCDVNAETFRKFIDLYISGRWEWRKEVDPDLTSCIKCAIDINCERWEGLKKLYDSDSDKTLDWG